MESTTLVAGAVQMSAVLADVPGNLAKAERLAREAFDKGARWVALPEFFTTPLGFDASLSQVALPPDGKALQMMLRVAAQYNGFIGGSFVTAENGDAFNRFYLVGPSGVLGIHDKDQPTMWENAYYIGGNDDGIIETPIGPVGASLCWEFVRSRTALRLRDKVDLVIGGSGWWSVPRLPAAAGLLKSWDAANREIMRQAPGQFARLVGAPVIHGAHCGQFTCRTPYLPFLDYRSYYLGEAQIVDGFGNILARRTVEQGEGVITAEVRPGRTGARDPLPARFWIPQMPAWMRAAWTTQNPHGTRHYRKTKLRKGFNWQQPDWK